MGDAFIDAAGEPVEIVDIVFDPTPTTVYNLEVDGAFTYFAEGVWVHDRSCPVILSLDRVHGGAWHSAFGQARAKSLTAQGARDVRWNQTLVNRRGERIAHLTPDLQYIGPENRVHIEEIVDTHSPSPLGETTFRDLLGDDFGSYIEHYRGDR